jgi:hypothetical protein
MDPVLERGAACGTRKRAAEKQFAAGRERNLIDRAASIVNREWQLRDSRMIPGTKKFYPTGIINRNCEILAYGIKRCCSGVLWKIACAEIPRALNPCKILRRPILQESRPVSKNSVLAITGDIYRDDGTGPLNSLLFN